MLGPLAKLFVEIGALTKPFDSALSGMRAKLAGLAKTPIRISPMAGLAAGLGAAAIGAGLKHVLDAGSDLNETINKTGVIFGGSAKVVEAGADEMAAKLGVVKTEFMDMSSTFGNLLEGMGGKSQAEAAEMSVALSKAAVDAGSMFNKSFEESAGAIASALRGQSEPISAFGVDVQEAAVKAEALRMGLVKGKEELDTHAKVAARASLVMQGLGISQGDAEKTATGYANASRGISGRLENLAGMVGKEILPAFEGFKALINEVLTDLTTNFDGMQGVLAGFSAFVQATVDTLGVIWRNWGLIVEYVSTSIGGYLTNIGETVTWLESCIGPFLDWFGKNWTTIFLDAFAAVTTALGNLATNFINFGKSAYEWIKSGFSKPFEFQFTPLMEGFEPITEALEVPALKLSSVGDQLAAIEEKMVANESKHADLVAAQKKDAAGAAPGKRVDEAAKKSAKDKKIEFSALDEFAKKLQTGLFEKDDHTRETARNTQQMVGQLDQLNRGIARIADDGVTGTLAD